MPGWMLNTVPPETCLCCNTPWGRGHETLTRLHLAACPPVCTTTRDGGPLGRVRQLLRHRTYCGTCVSLKRRKAQSWVDVGHRFRSLIVLNYRLRINGVILFKLSGEFPDVSFGESRKQHEGVEPPLQKWERLWLPRPAARAVTAARSGIRGPGCRSCGCVGPAGGDSCVCTWSRK